MCNPQAVAHIQPVYTQFEILFPPLRHWEPYRALQGAVMNCDDIMGMDIPQPSIKIRSFTSFGTFSKDFGCILRMLSSVFVVVGHT
jgi:hypothetical protein